LKLYSSKRLSGMLRLPDCQALLRDALEGRCLSRGAAQTDQKNGNDCVLGFDLSARRRNMTQVASPALARLKTRDECLLLGLRWGHGGPTRAPNNIASARSAPPPGRSDRTTGLVTLFPPTLRLPVTSRLDLVRRILPSCRGETNTHTATGQKDKRQRRRHTEPREATVIALS
jgi:hypothetical protein